MILCIIIRFLIIYLWASKVFHFSWFIIVGLESLCHCEKMKRADFLHNPWFPFANWIPECWRIVEDWINIFSFVGFLFCGSTNLTLRFLWRKFRVWIPFLHTTSICVFHFRRLFIITPRCLALSTDLNFVVRNDKFPLISFCNSFYLLGWNSMFQSCTASTIPIPAFDSPRYDIWKIQ